MKFIKINTYLHECSISVDIPAIATHFIFLTSELLSITDVVIVTGQDRNCVTFATNVPRKMYLFTLLRSVVSENLRRTAFFSSTNNRRTQRQFVRNRYAQQLCHKSDLLIVASVCKVTVFVPVDVVYML